MAVRKRKVSSVVKGSSSAKKVYIRDFVSDMERSRERAVEIAEKFAKSPSERNRRALHSALVSLGIKKTFIEVTASKVKKKKLIIFC